ncbi:uncharacterized protein M421DRAFT_351685 [Didymella exigua CBS 183.55]|uniref:Transmembrane protein n=1 Tax=Didymella exigua CBS 183.55 TaxID=1150837 RepID=A0A6A5R3L0_9PLEO|nr:uncharacterized protein M421DRAFT_351685 [Didymella exigua CBS 183.55]KAF1922655.1 hypothetical protein M421DRAFT_351685 [Didymella exigua CBS 183.55]
MAKRQKSSIAAGSVPVPRQVPSLLRDFFNGPVLAFCAVLAFCTVPTFRTVLAFCTVLTFRTVSTFRTVPTPALLLRWPPAISSSLYLRFCSSHSAINGAREQTTEGLSCTTLMQRLATSSRTSCTHAPISRFLFIQTTRRKKRPKSPELNSRKPLQRLSLLKSTD